MLKLAMRMQECVSHAPESQAVVLGDLVQPVTSLVVEWYECGLIHQWS